MNFKLRARSESLLSILLRK